MFLDGLVRLVSAGALPLLRLLLLFLLQETGRFEPKAPLAEDYDFIVVGSGSGGSTVASRLSEVEGWRVLLLEAGGLPPAESRIPAIASLSFLPGYSADWDYDSIPQKYGLGNFVNRAGRITQGKTLGGSSAINGLQWVRGSFQDFDNWASLGNIGWDYNSIRKYFKKAERYIGPPGDPASRNYGTAGPIHIKQIKPGPLTRAFMQGGQELGYPVLVDGNGPQNLGFAPPTVNIGNGVRSDVVEGYLKPVIHRPNLHILHSAEVHQVIFNERRRAVGVRFKHGGRIMTVGAKREVIVSAGAIGSPKLLMLSGVGPKEHLQEHGVKLVADVPGVGRNLHDHVNVMGLCWTVTRGLITSPVSFLTPDAIKQYATARQGPLAEIPAEAPSSWVHMGGDDPLWPDTQLFFNSFLPTGDFGIFYPSLYNLDRKRFTRYFQGLFGSEGYSIRPVLVRPKSRGEVRLSSGDPRAAPLVNPNYVSHPEDLRRLVDAMKFTVALGNTSAFVNNFQAKFYDQPLPECARERFGSDRYWVCYVRHMSTTFLHLAGSCKMAPSSDPLGVVDSSLRVRGVTGLRIIDASIMPEITTGNTQAPVLMIAEKGSDTIKRDWGILS